MMTPTMSMSGASLFGAPSLADRQADDAAAQSGLHERSRLVALRSEQAKLGGESARGRPPVVSASLIIAMQWVMFAACVVRVMMLS